MFTKEEVARYAAVLDQVAMEYEISVIPLFEEDYLREFTELFRIRSRGQKLVPAPEGFAAALRDLSGDDAWQPIADKTNRLFGMPKRVCVFADDEALRRELDRRRGLGPFFFLFDMLFCEYEGFTLCFLSGTNN